jgi:hypothetical protein
MISGSHSKERPKNDTTSVFTDTAVVLAHALSRSPAAALKTSPSTGISPSKIAQFSQQYLLQLKTIQNLHGDNILTDGEFGIEKRRIMANLRSLH